MTNYEIAAMVRSYIGDRATEAVKKGIVVTDDNALDIVTIPLALQQVKTSLSMGYISRKTNGIINLYCGKYGVGVTWDMPNYNSTRYHYRVYYVIPNAIRTDTLCKVLMMAERIANSDRLSIYKSDVIRGYFELCARSHCIIAAPDVAEEFKKCGCETYRTETGWYIGIPKVETHYELNQKMLKGKK